jgi:hypothetical protein
VPLKRGEWLTQWRQSVTSQKTLIVLMYLTGLLFSPQGDRLYCWCSVALLCHGAYCVLLWICLPVWVVQCFACLIVAACQMCKQSNGNAVSLSINEFVFCSPSLFYLLVHVKCRGFLFSLDHTQTHTTVGRTPLDKGLALTETSTWQHKHCTGDKHPCPRWNLNPRSSKQSAAYLRLRPRGHWDWPINEFIPLICSLCN